MDLEEAGYVLSGVGNWSCMSFQSFRQGGISKLLRLRLQAVFKLSDYYSISFNFIPR